MGKNAKRRREAKLRGQLDSAQSRPFDESALPAFESDYDLPAIFQADAHEDITDALVAELVTKHGWKEANVLQCRNQGMKYCRARNSFISPAQSF